MSARIFAWPGQGDQVPDSTKRPRKTPKQERSSELVSSILEACVRIFKSGNKALNFSTRSVAELAGVSVGSLYQYFPNKDALVGALIEREARLHVQKQEELYEQIKHESPEKVVHALVRQLLETIERDRRLLQGILKSIFFVERVDAIIEARESAIRFNARVLLEKGLARDEAEASTRAYVIAASLGGVVETLIFRKDAPVSLDALCDEASRMFLKYCK